MALEVSLAVQEELESRFEAVDRLRFKEVERAQYEAELARSRFMHVDPNNRMVADSLEVERNSNLLKLASVREEYERLREEDQLTLGAEQRARILALASDYPELWRSSRTSHRDRKRIVHLLIEDVTLRVGAVSGERPACARSEGDPVLQRGALAGLESVGGLEVSGRNDALVLLEEAALLEEGNDGSGDAVLERADLVGRGFGEWAEAEGVASGIGEVGLRGRAERVLAAPRRMPGSGGLAALDSEYSRTQKSEGMMSIWPGRTLMTSIPPSAGR